MSGSSASSTRTGLQHVGGRVGRERLGHRQRLDLGAGGQLRGARRVQRQPDGVLVVQPVGVAGEQRGGPSAASPRRRPGPARRRRPRAPAPAGSAPAPSRRASPCRAGRGRTCPCRRRPAAGRRRPGPPASRRRTAPSCPPATAWVSRLVMVCDLPVPGGPSSTKVRPASASAIARSCEASAGAGSCAASSSRSTKSPVSRAGSVNASVGSCTRWGTSGFSAKSAQCSSRSFHSRNLANCRIARSAVASTR